MTDQASAAPADVAGINPQIRQLKLADMVAAELRTRIVTGLLPDGARLPKQDDLLREFRVSRPPLREALRILEAEGLVSVQRGNVGGAIVRAPNARSSAYMFSLVLQTHQVTLGDLADAIRNVEPLAATLCARRKDRRRTVLPRLRACMKEASAALDDEVTFTAASRRFHEEIVRGCGNETLVLMLGTLELMWSQQERQWARRAQAEDAYPTAKERAAALAAHRAMVVAIERGEDDLAARVARTHLTESQLYALSEGTTDIVQAVDGLDRSTARR